jgi:hypothetical protein
MKLKAQPALIVEIDMSIWYKANQLVTMAQLANVLDLLPPTSIIHLLDIDTQVTSCSAGYCV